ncbi:MAG: hypothetical protein M3547_08250 [Acidobacteriota bacterium]|nr:hypothetical protein [Acidobacteriota bacterium]
MRKTVLFSALILAFAASASASPCNPKKNSLPAPTGFTALADSDSVDASWTAVTGATKYSVEVVVHYNACTLEEEFEFTVFAPATSISIPLSELTTCIDLLCTGGPIAAQGVEIKVKALNPPQGKNKLAQCNPFSSTVFVDFCGDGVDGDCDETIDEGCALPD